MHLGWDIQDSFNPAKRYALVIVNYDNQGQTVHEWIYMTSCSRKLLIYVANVLFKFGDHKVQETLKPHYIPSGGLKIYAARKALQKVLEEA